MAENTAQVAERFRRKSLSESQISTMTVQQNAFGELARAVTVYTLPGREQSLALTALQEAKFWANEAISMEGSD